MAIKAGMTYKEAMHSTPLVIQMYIDAYLDKKKEEQTLNMYLPWKIGLYVCNAISACFGKDIKYPKQPLELDEDNNIKEEKQLSDEEKSKLEMEKIFMIMNIKQANFELSKKFEGGSDE